ncbi:hypothetical protein BpHYR1_005390 [Brachionus plicatilis]|uniref:Uncharacterized protein n=1 Tax=Brachionus plicatilis TaxID=10195 RepID=A0A3M7R0W8_BRAPC|nr:hypothetical protein BpHYR1_005390 [Brachionus plicatilis]
MESTPSSSPMLNQQQQQQTPNTAAVNLTPEQEQEIKLRSKYPNPQKPGASNFIQKMLHKGVRNKHFLFFHLSLPK